MKKGPSQTKLMKVKNCFNSFQSAWKFVQVFWEKDEMGFWQKDNIKA